MRTYPNRWWEFAIAYALMAASLLYLWNYSWR